MDRPGWSVRSYADATILRERTAGSKRRRFARASALLAVMALVPASSGSANAAPREVSAGHILCQEAYCTVFGPGAPLSHGAPGSQGLFTIFCPLVEDLVAKGAASNGGNLIVDGQFDHAVPYVSTWPGGDPVPVTDYSQGTYGGKLAFWNFAFTVPDKSADALSLIGGGYCVFKNDQYNIGLVQSTEWDYFWIDNPNYWKLSSAVLAALAGQFGTMQLITDEGFGAAGFGANGSPVSGGPVVGPTPSLPTTTTKGGQRPPVTTTTSTTLPPTTTTTRRGAR